MVGRIRFALERWDSPRRSSHVAQLFSLGHIERMEKTKPRLRWVRGAVASVIVFLFLAALIPNLMYFREFVVYVGILLVPLACIHFGADRFRFLEYIGWFLLVSLLLLEIIEMS